MILFASGDFSWLKIINLNFLLKMVILILRVSCMYVDVGMPIHLSDRSDMYPVEV